MAEEGKAVGELVAALRTGDASARVAAAEALCHRGSEAQEAATTLVAACADEDGQVREWVAAALEEFGPPPADAVGELAGLAQVGNPLVAYWAVTLLGRLGEGAASAVTDLAACLRSEVSIEVRQRAAWALARIGPAAAAARAPLLAASQDADPRLARLASEALASLGG